MCRDQLASGIPCLKEEESSEEEVTAAAQEQEPVPTELDGCGPQSPWRTSPSVKTRRACGDQPALQKWVVEAANLLIGCRSPFSPRKP